MKTKRFLELLTLGVAGHSGCIIACLGLGATGVTPGCAASAPVGHPLTYLASQAVHLTVALAVVWLYLRLANELHRIPLVLLLAALLWVPALGTYAAFSLQAVFLVQVFRLLFGRYFGIAELDCCSPRSA